MKGISLDFHCFKALNNNFEAWLFFNMFIFKPHQIFWWRVGPYTSDFFKLGTVLTYAFNNLDVRGHDLFNSDENIPVGWFIMSIPGVPIKTEQSIQSIFSGLCSDQQLSFFTLLDRTSFPHNNDTKIIKFGWKLLILWVISYGLSFSRFARFPEFRSTINDKSMANPENDSP